MLSRYLFMTLVTIFCFFTWWEVSDIKQQVQDVDRSISQMCYLIQRPNEEKMTVIQGEAHKAMVEFIKELRKEIHPHLAKLDEALLLAQHASHDGIYLEKEEDE